MIYVEGLRKVFHPKDDSSPIVAIEQLDFDIAQGEMVAIVGQTGCGKSTFLNIVMGIERPTSGRVSVDGKSPYEDFQSFKGKIAAIFQQDRLLPWRTSLQNAKLGLEILGIDEAEQIKRTSEWLEKLGLTGFLNSYPSELSGGMRQRVALARAFAVRPEILLADEAFGHLDEVTASRLRKEFLQLASECGATSILVTHQLDEAIEVGGRILVFGRPARLLADLRIDEEMRSRRDEMEALRKRIQRMIDSNAPASAIEEKLS